ncbi:hypothetical protein FJ251_10505 [bacterium]|nr:hypothetical protein [bacterium]
MRSASALAAGFAALLLIASVAGAQPADKGAAPAPADTANMTPLQRVLWQAKQGMGRPAAAPADTFALPAGVRRLTRSEADEGRCDFSPDGKTLYFDTMQSGLHRLQRLDLGTGAATPLNEPPREGFSPAVSPDGRYLVFVRNLPQLPHKLWVMRLEDGEEAKLTPDGTSQHEGDPVWSHNGGTIYYSLSNNGTPNATPMAIARTGENQQALEQGPGSYHVPAPSPSGGKIAWALRLGKIKFLRVNDARISAISEDFEFPGYYLASADWLPGERRLVVSYLVESDPMAGYRLGFVDLDSGQLTPWLPIKSALDPRVSPDGKQVAFRARTPDGGYDLFLADLP